MLCLDTTQNPAAPAAVFIQPPSGLAGKVDRGDFSLGATMIRSADRAHRRHLQATDYREVARVKLAQLSAAIEHDHGAIQVYEIAHDLRGEAGSFGYGAIARVAELMCRLIEATGADAPPVQLPPTRPAPPDRRLMELLLATILALLAADIRLPAGAPSTAHQVLEGLAGLVAKALHKPGEAASGGRRWIAAAAPRPPGSGAIRERA